MPRSHTQDTLLLVEEIQKPRSAPGERRPAAPAVPSISGTGGKIEALVRAARRRMWVNAALQSLASQAPLILFVLLLAVVGLKVARLADGWTVSVVAAAAAFLVGAVGWAMLRIPGRIVIAELLDRRSGRQGGLLSAFEILHRLNPGPSGQARVSEGYEILIVQREAAKLDQVDVRAVIPICASQRLWWNLLLSGAVAFVLPYEMPRVSTPPKPPEAALPDESALEVAPDDIELLRRDTERLAKEMESEEGRELASETQEMVERLARAEMTAAEVLAASASLEARLSEKVADDWLSRELKKRGDSLSGAKLSRPAGQALSEGRRKDAEEALRQLAERLSDERRAPSQAELEELREALEKAREVAKASEQAEDAKAKAQSQRLEDKRRRLLKKKESGRASASELRELEDAERRLRKLTRRQKQQQQTLSDLDRQLAEAAQALQKERKKAGEFVDQAAQTLEQSQGRQLTDEEKKKLLEELRKLKERVRKKGSENYQKRLDEFRKRAGGKKPGGQGEGQSQGASSIPIPVPVPGQASSGSPGNGEKTSDKPGPGGGSKPGHTHDPNLQGDVSSPLDSKHQDVTAAAQDTGEGQSASETILSAAEEGFAAGSYQNLYTDYQTVLEDVLRKDQIPPGRRGQVERYFELIRPRAVQQKDVPGRTPRKTE